MNYQGVVIKESLEDRGILKNMRILSTKVELVTKEHETPWLKQWTLHTIEVPEGQADDLAERISRALDSEHPWYADFKNDASHFIIFRDKVFKIDRREKEQYNDAIKFGISLGIPAHQLNFSPDIKE